MIDTKASPEMHNAWAIQYRDKGSEDEWTTERTGPMMFLTQINDHVLGDISDDIGMDLMYLRFAHRVEQSQRIWRNEFEFRLVSGFRTGHDIDKEWTYTFKSCTMYDKEEADQIQLCN